MARKSTIGAAFVAVAVAVVAWFAVEQKDDGAANKPATSSARPTTSATTKSPVRLTAATSNQLESALVSRDTATYRSTWVRKDVLPPRAPTGTVVSINVGTFKPLQDIGQVTATVTQPGKAPQTRQLILQLADGHWLVSGWKR